MERELLIEKQQRGANIKETNKENTILNTENYDFKEILHRSRLEEKTYDWLKKQSNLFCDLFPP